MHKKLMLIALLYLVLSPVAARASTIYSYVGNPYDDFDTYIPIGSQPDNNFPPFTPQMAITGSFELADALAPNLSLSTVVPLSFSFSNGQHTFTSAQPIPSFTYSFKVSTDGSGNIVGWDIFLETDLVSPGVVGQRIDAVSSTTLEDLGQIRLCAALGAGAEGTDCGVIISYQAGRVSGNPGTWVQEVTPVPEPATLTLVGLGIVGLAARRRRATR